LDILDLAAVSIVMWLWWDQINNSDRYLW